VLRLGHITLVAKLYGEESLRLRREGFFEMARRRGGPVARLA
jgi:hypothetical protein